MGNDYVLDTCVLVYSMSECSKFDCVELLCKIKRKNKMICVDFEEEILKEYRGKRLYEDSFTCKFLDTMERTKRIIRIFGRLEKKDENYLKFNKFDSNDLKFLAVANRTPSKKLVSDDSDYDEENVHEYICKKMRIVLQKPIDALNEID